MPVKSIIEVDVDDEAFTTTMEWLWEQGGTMFLSGFLFYLFNQIF